MNLIRVKDYEELSKKAAEIVIKKVKNSHFLSLGLATGSSPLGLYQLLVNNYAKSYTSYEHIVTFNLDEYVGIKINHPNSYHTYMQKHLFQHIDVPKDQIHIPDPSETDLEEVCKEYEKEIEANGGIDFQILGIGSNGHIGFNEPGTPFDSLTHIVTLDEKTRKDNARFFSSLDEVPTQAISMGINTILNSKEILLLVSGKNKADALYQLFYEDVSEHLPASCLKLHPNVTIIADEDALSQFPV